MTTSFLDQAAERILAENSDELKNTLILLPNKRGELFLKKAMAKQLTKPALAPEMLSIEEFVQQVSGLQKQNQLQLIVRLFKVYVDAVNASESFDSFIKWGNMLLHDFNEIDRHLVDKQQLFNNLLDAKTIESWGVEPGQETELMSSFLSFWKSLEPLYDAFNNALETDGFSYQGKAYRKVAEDLSRIDLSLKGKYNKIYLLGFNALNKAEEMIFQHLAEAHNAILLWDADDFYMNDPLHEAGVFLRKYKSKWRVFGRKPFEWQSKIIERDPKKIQVIAAPSHIGMSAATSQILNGLPIEDQLSTAVVLADESMLLPILDGIPAAYKDINVTMGLSLMHAPLIQDVLAIFKLHEQAERTASSGSGYAYHHRTFLGVVESVLFKQAAQEKSQLIIGALTDSNSVFISPNSAVKLLTNLGFESNTWQQIFCKPEDSKQLVIAIDELLKEQFRSYEGIDRLTNQSAYELHQVLRQLKELLGDLEVPLENKTLFRLFQSMLSELQVDFYGEPLAGLQVMGMLETRTLDFKRVVITSLNEGILPAGKSQNSFIPYDLKRHFGLPTHHEKDAVYAYHFYRLLQRAEEVYLIYDTDMIGVGSKEKSRFILQIEHELGHLPNIDLQAPQHFAPEVKKESLLALPSYQKETAVFDRLKELSIKGFSPSAMSAYLIDPVQFYIERLLRVRDPEEISESIGHDVLGTVVHEALEELYIPFLNNTVTFESLQNKKPEVEEVVLKMISQHYRGSTSSGKNLLIKRVAIHMVNEVLREDLKRIKKLNAEGFQLKIEMLEEELKHACKVPGIDHTILYRGFADRIEREGNTVYVLDFKTGFVANNELKCQDVDQIFDPSKKKSKAFQVLFYAWLYVKQNGMPSGGLKAGLFSTRSPSLGFDRLKLNRDELINESDLEQFEENLFKLTQELFEATKPFEQRLLI